MESIFKKNKYFYIIFLLLSLIIVLSILSPYFSKTKKQDFEPTQNINNQKDLKSKTWQDVPENVTVPNTNDQNLPENVAKPKNVSPASAVSDASIRNFEKLIIENDKFKPDTFIVRQGDVFDVFATAIDKNYDWVQPDFGYTIKINQGETKRIQFQTTAIGKFVFYCQLCGGPNKGPIGYLIVAPKK